MLLQEVSIDKRTTDLLWHETEGIGGTYDSHKVKKDDEQKITDVLDNLRPFIKKRHEKNKNHILIDEVYAKVDNDNDASDEKALIHYDHVDGVHNKTRISRWSLSENQQQVLKKAKLLGIRGLNPDQDLYRKRKK